MNCAIDGADSFLPFYPLCSYDYVPSMVRFWLWDWRLRKREGAPPPSMLMRRVKADILLFSEVLPWSP